MKKWFIYLLLLVVIPFFPLGSEDVGKLYPVQAVMVRPEKGGIIIQTDGGQVGWGKDVVAAMENLKETSSVRVFLDTADYLLLEPGMDQWLQQLQQYLRPSCSVCYVSVPVDVAEAAVYLQLHDPKLTLSGYEAGKRPLPTLIYNEGRMTLVRS